VSLYQLENITQVVGKNKILEIENLEIQAGEIYALLGPNGAGKTTLLNLLGFLEKPTSGQIRFMGQTVKFAEKHLQQLRRNVVMVNQRPILFSTSVYKNMEFGLKIRQIKSAKRRQIIEENLALVGLSHLLDAPAHKLSGGETQRIVLARALALSPKIILCDEPTSSVDLESQQTIIRLLKKINIEQHITIILTSHNQPEVNMLAHHSFFIDRGKLSKAGYENLFSAEILKQNGEHICLIDGQIRIKTKERQTGPCRVTIDPCEISLVSNSDFKSANNYLKGMVRQVMFQDSDEIQMLISCGINLIVKISIEQYQSVKPMVGEKICLLIKSQAVHIL
jgi:tungstate transport system ATP-binding protein